MGTHYCPNSDAMVDNETGKPAEQAVGNQITDIATETLGNISPSDCPTCGDKSEIHHSK
jgi:hypothetical protein